MRLPKSNVCVCDCAQCECVVSEDLPMELFGRQSERNRFIFILVLLARRTAKFVVVVVHLLLFYIA